MTHMNFQFDVKDVKRMIKEKVINETAAKSDIYDFLDDLYYDNTISRDDYYDLRNFVRSLNCRHF